MTLHAYLSFSEYKREHVRVGIAGSSFNPRMYNVHRQGRRTERILTANFDDISDSGEPGILEGIRTYPRRRSGALKVQERSSAYAGMALAQHPGISIGVAQKTFTQDSGFPPTLAEV